MKKYLIIVSLIFILFLAMITVLTERKSEKSGGVDFGNYTVDVNEIEHLIADNDTETALIKAAELKKDISEQPSETDTSKYLWIMFIASSGLILNFVNTMIMSIHTRQKEIAALQGMTGKQLRKMLIYEGLIYVSGAGAVSLLLNLISFPLGRFVEKVFWFCEFKYSFIPLAVTIPVLVAAGIIIPIVTYRIYVKKSIVERLRTNE